MKDTALRSSKPQVVSVEFDPQLLGYEEVKPRLPGMKVDAPYIQILCSFRFVSLSPERAHLTIPRPFPTITTVT